LTYTGIYLSPVKRGVKISTLPKLVIKPFGYGSGTICDSEQARNRINYDGMIVLFDGRRVHSHDELAQIANQDSYKNKDVVEVVLLPKIEGG
jgi:hypothetical protein